MVEVMNPALVGQLVVLLLLVAVVWFVFKEVARVALKFIIPAAAVMGIAVWLGLLDETIAGNLLEAVGQGVLTGIRVVAQWVTSAAFSA
ncbi:MAG: hypothetical protein ACR2QM_05235 [Longimicrobiales bacterium]